MERDEIAVGDTVTWRSGKSTNKGRGQPIGIANCKVLELGETAAGQPAAMLKLPPPFADGIAQHWGLDASQPVGALVADLEKAGAV